MVTKGIFYGVLFALVLQRLLEMRRSRRNTERIKAAGGYEHAAEHYKWMILLHATWFLCMVAEVAVLNAEMIPWLAVVAGIGVVAGQLLRLAAIRTLGERWTTRIMIVPNAPVISDGLYRYIRHPNYLGVILEIACVPLMHGAYRTAALFSVLNGALLWVRIKAEEEALSAENNYAASLGDRGRFVPKGRA